MQENFKSLSYRKQPPTVNNNNQNVDHNSNNTNNTTNNTSLLSTGYNSLKKSLPTNILNKPFPLKSNIPTPSITTTNNTIPGVPSNFLKPTFKSNTSTGKPLALSSNGNDTTNPNNNNNNNSNINSSNVTSSNSFIPTPSHYAGGYSNQLDPNKSRGLLLSNKPMAKPMPSKIQPLKVSATTTNPSSTINTLSLPAPNNQINDNDITVTGLPPDDNDDFSSTNGIENYDLDVDIDSLIDDPPQPPQLQKTNNNNNNNIKQPQPPQPNNNYINYQVIIDQLKSDLSAKDKSISKLTSDSSKLIKLQENFENLQKSFEKVNKEKEDVEKKLNNTVKQQQIEKRKLEQQQQELKNKKLKIEEDKMVTDNTNMNSIVNTEFINRISNQQQLLLKQKSTLLKVFSFSQGSPPTILYLLPRNYQIQSNLTIPTSNSSNTNINTNNNNQNQNQNTNIASQFSKTGNNSLSSASQLQNANKQSQNSAHSKQQPNQQSLTTSKELVLVVQDSKNNNVNTPATGTTNISDITPPIQLSVELSECLSFVTSMQQPCSSLLKKLFPFLKLNNYFIMSKAIEVILILLDSSKECRDTFINNNNNNTNNNLIVNKQLLKLSGNQNITVYPLNNINSNVFTLEPLKSITSPTTTPPTTTTPINNYIIPSQNLNNINQETHNTNNNEILIFLIETVTTIPVNQQNSKLLINIFKIFQIITNNIITSPKNTKSLHMEILMRFEIVFKQQFLSEIWQYGSIDLRESYLDLIEVLISVPELTMFIYAPPSDSIEDKENPSNLLKKSLLIKIIVLLTFPQSCRSLKRKSITILSKIINSSSNILLSIRELLFQSSIHFYYMEYKELQQLGFFDGYQQLYIDNNNNYSSNNNNSISIEEELFQISTPKSEPTIIKDILELITETLKILIFIWKSNEDFNFKSEKEIDILRSISTRIKKCTQIPILKEIVELTHKLSEILDCGTVNLNDDSFCSDGIGGASYSGVGQSTSNH